MSVDDFFQRLIAALERSGVPYMVTGSYASSAHGVPRATNDIDIVIVIAPSLDQLRGLIRELPDDRYYADELDAVDALKHQSQFNVIDFATTWKADLIIRKNRAFSTEEFARRRTHTIAGVEVRLATAEDILLAKLEWYKEGESARQLEDIVGIIRRQGTSLDREYVEYWVAQLGVEDQWREALAAAG
jgi:hypothetical protein